ncbi:hypothetical protein MMC13_007270 [Lambiella insularis]|nr:hypothetical protein [Lambiella insularis]
MEEFIRASDENGNPDRPYVYSPSNGSHSDTDSADSFDASSSEDSFEDRDSSSGAGAFYYNPINTHPRRHLPGFDLARCHLSKAKEEMMLDLLRLDMAMLPYFLGHGCSIFRGKWVYRKLQNFRCQVPIPFPVNDSAYESWLIGSAIGFIEQHNENIGRLRKIVREVHSDNLNPRMDMIKQGAVPVKRYPDGSTGYLEDLVVNYDSSFRKMKDYGDLIDMTEECVRGLARDMVGLGRDWLKCYPPWQQASFRHEVEKWSKRLSGSEPGKLLDLEELAQKVQWIYGNPDKAKPNRTRLWNDRGAYSSGTTRKSQ